jgi:hypothetical protein
MATSRLCKRGRALVQASIVVALLAVVIASVNGQVGKPSPTNDQLESNATGPRNGDTVRASQEVSIDGNTEAESEDPLQIQRFEVKRQHVDKAQFPPVSSVVESKAIPKGSCQVRADSSGRSLWSQEVTAGSALRCGSGQVISALRQSSKGDSYTIYCQSVALYCKDLIIPLFS